MIALFYKNINKISKKVCSDIIFFDILCMVRLGRNFRKGEKYEDKTK